MLLFAVIGYIMSSFGYSIIIVIIAFFLGPRFEISIAQTLALTNGDLTRIVNHPVAVALLVLSVLTVIYLLRHNRASQ
jgi:putative tricarboxylic transport membrane protein